MRSAIKSKKFAVTLAAFLVVLLEAAGLKIDEQSMQNMIYLAMSYIVGQGVADIGKEKAKVEKSG